MGLRQSPSRFVVAAAALSVLVPAPLTAAAADGEPPGKPITVMTRNVYLGADITRPIEAAAGITDPVAALTALGNAAYQTRQIVDRTNFPLRSDLLAAEIATAQPDLVGLQEVSLWRSGPTQVAPGLVGVPNATTVDYDYLAILLESLRDAGVEYAPVSVQVESDVEAPSFQGPPTPANLQAGRDVRLTVHDVILMRADNALRVVDSGSGQYAARLVVPVAGRPFSFVRGYNWVDVRAGSRELRFINTHFEAFSSDLALAQAAELAAGPANHDGTTVIACDCNSDPLNGRVKPHDSQPHWAAYRFLTGAAGFTDQWLAWSDTDPGWTAGLSETVDDATPARIDHRIDLILARTASGEGLQVDRGQVTGDEPADQDPVSRLWPSDHAGVVLRLRGAAPTGR